MDFSDALRDMKQGYKVYRRYWREGNNAPWLPDGVYCRIASVIIEGRTALDQIIVEFPDGRLAPFAGAQTDLLGNDWELVKG